MQLILTMDSDRQRNAEDLLRKVCSQGWANLDVLNQDAAHLLRKYELVSFADMGNIIHPTPKGEAENEKRALRVA